MLGWFLRLLLLFLVVRAVMLLVGGLVRGLIRAAQVPPPDDREPAAGPRGQVARSNGTLVQDPVCGTYVVPGKALTGVVRGQVVHYCSEACRTRHVA